MSRKVIVLIVIVIVAIAVVRFRTRDISAVVFKTETAVLSVLQSYGVTDNDVVYREEDDWKKPGLRGKSLNYVVKLKAWASSNELAEAIKKEIQGVKGVDLAKVYYRRGKDEKGTAYFEIVYKGDLILLLTVENVSSGWIKGGKPQEVHPKLALVLDDFGYTRKNLDYLKELEIPLTIAVLPNAPYSKKVSAFAKKNGVEVILHLPMEPERKNVQLEKDTIMVGMEKDTVKDIINRALKTVPEAQGVSNHQGSKATGDEGTMDIVLGEVKKRDLFYLDSLTTSDSVCGKVAGEKGLPCVRRDVFLDMEFNEDHVRQQLEKAENVARAKGYAVAIGHEKKTTLRVLKEMVPGIKERGIEFVALSEIVELENAGQGSK